MIFDCKKPTKELRIGDLTSNFYTFYIIAMIYFTVGKANLEEPLAEATVTLTVASPSLSETSSASNSSSRRNPRRGKSNAWLTLWTPSTSDWNTLRRKLPDHPYISKIYFKTSSSQAGYVCYFYKPSSAVFWNLTGQ